MTKTFKQAILLLSLTLGQTAMADQLGTKLEAQQMLTRVVAAMEADRPAALAAINAGDDGYRVSDLYPFCFENAADGVATAHGHPDSVVGLPNTKIIDKNGTIITGQMLPWAEEGTFKTAAYWWPLPGGSEPMEKEAFYTLVAGEICGVGYYK